ncbi:MAG: DUF928 domain-containing protein [Gammaproteobacteria bacterium]|nr:DUF928 domain-containing protein [Gammaproteobacteria bacterium]
MFTKKSIGISIGIALLAAGTAPAVMAGQESAAAAKKTVKTFSYKPPLVIGGPTRRIGGGTRGASDKLPSVAVFAPEHTGHTVSAQPTLYWSIANASLTPATFSLTLVHADPMMAIDNPEPLLKVVVKPENGAHSLSLAKHGVTLETDVEYKWSVAVSTTPGQHSRDIVSSATIKRVENKVAEQLSGKNLREYPAVYAEAGLWYDSVASLSALIAADPANAELRQQRADLLRQAGLQDFVNL